MLGGSHGVLVEGGHSDLIELKGPDVLCREKMRQAPGEGLTSAGDQELTPDLQLGITQPPIAELASSISSSDHSMGVRAEIGKARKGAGSGL